MLGLSWGAWWGLNLETPAAASLPPQTVRELEAAGLIPAGTAAQLGGVIVTKRTSRTYRPELVMSAGPRELAQPGGGTFGELYGAAWALGLYRTGPRLFQSRAGVWVERHDPDALSALAPRGVRHVSLSFDQSARPVLAWEVSGAVYVRQWEAGAQQYVTRGPWAGREPLLLADPAAGVPVSSSDVLLIHAADAGLTVRVQRELYAAPHVLAALPAGAVLDQVTALPYSWQVLGEAAGARLALLSDLYPTQNTDAGRAALSGPQGGELFALVIVRAPDPDEAGAALSGPQGGELFALVIVRDLGTLAAVNAAVTGPLGGEYLDAVLIRTVTPEAVNAALSAPQGGEYPQIVVSHAPTPEAMNAALSGPQGGIYTT